VKTCPYQEAFERIQGEYLEMPGMRLTPAQVERRSGLDRATCTCVLEGLVQAKFLYVGPNNTYARCIGTRSVERAVREPLTNRRSELATLSPLRRYDQVGATFANGMSPSPRAATQRRYTDDRAKLSQVLSRKVAQPRYIGGTAHDREEDVTACPAGRPSTFSGRMGD
jgi:hypothetical protein